MKKSFAEKVVGVLEMVWGALEIIVAILEAMA